MGSVADGARDVIVRLVTELWNERRWHAADELFEPYWDNGPELPPGPAGVRMWHESTAKTFPDLRYEVLQVVCDDSGQAAFRWRARGTHRGEFGSVPPTGKVIEYEGAHFVAVRSGKIVDLWSINDTFGKLQQMGVEFVPPPSRGSLPGEE
jgi:predicted ester cyclase